MLVPQIARALSSEGHHYGIIFDGEKRLSAYRTYAKIRHLPGHMFSVFDDVYDSSIVGSRLQSLNIDYDDRHFVRKYLERSEDALWTTFQLDESLLAYERKLVMSIPSRSHGKGGGMVGCSMGVTGMLKDHFAIVIP